MRKCAICHSFLVPCNEGIDHIGFSAKGGSASGGEPHIVDKAAFICQSCLHAIQNQMEYGVACEYAEA
jgi:hypothetical protein